MTYEISPDRKRLTIRVDTGERSDLVRQTQTSGIQSDEAMHDWFESLIANSELEWINPADTGDLTDAPMLGVYGEERPFVHGDETIPHRVTGPNLIQEVMERWAFLDYALRSPLEDLRDKGFAEFTG